MNLIIEPLMDEPIADKKPKKKVERDEEEEDEEEEESDDEEDTDEEVEEDVEDEEGWAFLGEVGTLLQKKQPNFDARNYGFKKLTPLVKSIGQIEIGSRKNPKGNGNLIYVRTMV